MKEEEIKEKRKNIFVISHEEEKEISITNQNKEGIRLTKKQALFVVQAIQDCIQNW